MKSSLPNQNLFDKNDMEKNYNFFLFMALKLIFVDYDYYNFIAESLIFPLNNIF